MYEVNDRKWLRIAIWMLSIAEAIALVPMVLSKFH